MNTNKWLGFTLDTSDDVCREKFIKRFGYMPQKVFVAGAVKLAGPVIEEATDLQE